MLHTQRCSRGMVVAPHHLAAESGLGVLRAGGTAIEAMVAAAATIAVVFPHMTGLGGDGFWLMAAPGRPPVGVDACGRAAAAASLQAARAQWGEALPPRGAAAALTVAGTVSGWQAALAENRDWGGEQPLESLLADATHYAEAGYPVTESQHAATAQPTGSAEALWQAPGFAAVFRTPDGRGASAPGTVLRQPALAETLRTLARDGLDSFYRGPLATRIAADLAAVGSPLGRADLAGQRAERVTPLTLPLGAARLFNLGPPTQGVASLMILGLFERVAARLGRIEAGSYEHIHALVEATKQAYRRRDAAIADPAVMHTDSRDILASEALARAAAAIDPTAVAPWPAPPDAGDTVWMGAIDGQGRAVSFIQSLYWEFGSGVVLPETGLVWQNRGTAFSLDPASLRSLAPRRKPFHTLNPALARFQDGRVMVYGSMGGDGQPQTQAAVFTRYAHFGQGLQEAVTAPRWLLGRTWGDTSTTLKIENRVPRAVVDALRAAGHAVETVAPYTSVMGHAGALVRSPDGVIEGAADPRSHGSAAGW